jgi:hypothetical protein
MIKTSRPSQVGVRSCDGIAGIAGIAEIAGIAGRIAGIATTARFKAIIIIASVVYAVGDTVNRIILK